MRRVVVTGFGAYTPIGNTEKEIKESFYQGKSGTVYIPEWKEIKGLQSFVAGTVKNFDEKILDRKLRRSMGKLSMMTTSAAKIAIEDSGLSEEVLHSGRMGCAASSTIGSPKAYEDFFYELLINKSIEQIPSMTFLKLMNHTTAANIATPLGIKGRVFSPSSECTSSSQSIGMSYEAIYYCLQDVMVAGEAEELHYTAVSVFDIMDVACRTANETPEKASQPFDKNRGGVVVGEGAGMVILEEYEHAKARGAKIYGEIIGFSSLCDGFHLSTPSSEGMEATMRAALANAGIKEQDVDYINMHATATHTGDIAESAATRAVFGDKTPVSATKSYTGHTLGASGVHEFIYSLFMMQDNKIYPTINLEELDPECAGVNMITELTDKELNTVMTNNFAFGGINTSIILKKI